ncbi:MAG TPA: PilZ domain-containing protein [Gemmataceae bacterium]|nr:PilZ domain-containing protein [Gemmataceae bacterium]
MSDLSDSPNLPSLVHSDQTHLRLPSRPAWIEPAVEYLKTRAVLCGACQETRAGKLMIALHEALSNAVVHGNLELSSELKDRSDDSFARELATRANDPRLAERIVDVVVDYDGERCQWIVTDEGSGFDVEAVLQRLESDDPEVLSRGRGILMMRSFLDEVRYEEGGRRCVLTLRRGSGAERRHFSRAAVHKPLKVVPIRPDGTVDWDAAYEAVSKNFSEDGVGLLQARLATTDRIIIAIATEGAPLYVPVEVRHCRRLGSDLVELGCRFQRKDAPPAPDPLAKVHEAVGNLLERLDVPAAAFDERRAHPRVNYNERVEIRLGPHGGALVGFARDLSRGGIAFITTVPLLHQACVLLLPQTGGGLLRVRAQIMRCAKVQEGFYDVGARFVELVDAPA